MSTPSRSNPHRVYCTGYDLVFWRNGAASGRSDADTVEVQQLLEGCGRVSVTEFRLPEERGKLESLEIAFARMFEVGRLDKANEIRKALGL